jgi:hypothetical protein
MRDLNPIATASKSSALKPTSARTYTAAPPLRRRPGPKPGTKPKQFRLVVTGPANAGTPNKAEVGAILGLAGDLVRQHVFPTRLEP